MNLSYLSDSPIARVRIFQIINKKCIWFIFINLPLLFIQPSKSLLVRRLFQKKKLKNIMRMRVCVLGCNVVSQCNLCGKAVGTSQHLFWNCASARKIFWTWFFLLLVLLLTLLLLMLFWIFVKYICLLNVKLSLLLSLIHYQLN